MVWKVNACCAGCSARGAHGQGRGRQTQQGESSYRGYQDTGTCRNMPSRRCCGTRTSRWGRSAVVAAVAGRRLRTSGRRSRTGRLRTRTGRIGTRREARRTASCHDSFSRWARDSVQHREQQERILVVVESPGVRSTVARTLAATHRPSREQGFPRVPQITLSLSHRLTKLSDDKFPPGTF